MDKQAAGNFVCNVTLVRKNEVFRLLYIVIGNRMKNDHNSQSVTITITTSFGLGPYFFAEEVIPENFSSVIWLKSHFNKYTYYKIFGPLGLSNMKQLRV
jgi:hypothetical protein